MAQKEEKHKKQKRTQMPRSVESQVLLASRHACCVCQKPRVQLHHIDEDPSNNTVENIAALCTDHHDMATMQTGLTKKLKAEDVRKYKRSWEEKCRHDLMALSRDRVNFFCTLYKNPPRIREQFLQLPAQVRKTAVENIMRVIPEEEKERSAEGGFDFQMLPRDDKRTLACLDAAKKGETWPFWLPRVKSHSEDPDLPVDMGPPHGMQVYHTFDLHCQVMTQVLTAASAPVPFEYLCGFTDPEDINTFSGALVSFREAIRGKGVQSPRSSKENPTGSLQIIKRKKGLVHRANMHIRNMYVFSDTSAENLRNCRVCGIGILAGAEKVGKSGKSEIHMTILPLLVGMGGFGQSDRTGWKWNLK